MYEKPYIDFMNEIDPEELLEGLISQGLFYDKMPPFLSGDSFLAHIKTAQGFGGHRGTGAIFKSARCNGKIREISIPNPFACANMARLLARRWDSIRAHFAEMTRGSTFKISRIHLRKPAARRTSLSGWHEENSALFRMNRKCFAEDGDPLPLLDAYGTVWLHADIQKCYPSIRPAAVLNALGNVSWEKELKNALKLLCADGGLPIGPHLSNILGEIVLTRIDHESQDANKRWRFIRFIDDYCCRLENPDDIPVFLSTLQKNLAMFGLSLNEEKTEHSDLVRPIDPEWVTELKTGMRLWLMSHAGRITLDDARGFLDTAAAAYYKSGKNAAVFTFALKSLFRAADIAGITQPALEHTLLRMLHLWLRVPYVAAATCARAQAFLAQSLMDFPRAKTLAPLMKELINRCYDQALRASDGELASWMIWLAMELGCGIEGIHPEHAALFDCASAKLAHWLWFSLDKKNQKSAAVTGHAQELVKDGAFPQYWFFIYEAFPQHSLEGDWTTAKAAGVSFLKDSWREALKQGLSPQPWHARHPSGPRRSYRPRAGRIWDTEDMEELYG